MNAIHCFVNLLKKSIPRPLSTRSRHVTNDGFGGGNGRQKALPNMLHLDNLELQRRKENGEGTELQEYTGWG